MTKQHTQKSARREFLVSEGKTLETPHPTPPTEPLILNSKPSIDWSLTWVIMIELPSTLVECLIAKDKGVESRSLPSWDSLSLILSQIQLTFLKQDRDPGWSQDFGGSETLTLQYWEDNAEILSELSTVKSTLCRLRPKWREFVSTFIYLYYFTPALTTDFLLALLYDRLSSVSALLNVVIVLSKSYLLLASQYLTIITTSNARNMHET